MIWFLNVVARVLRIDGQVSGPTVYPGRRYFLDHLDSDGERESLDLGEGFWDSAERLWQFRRAGAFLKP